MEQSKNNNLKLLLIKLLNRETINYLIFGVLTTLINIIIYRICTSVDIVFWISDIIAWITALIFAFITNKLFVFRSKNMNPAVIFKEGLTFVAARLFSGVCDLGFLIFAVKFIHMDDFIAKIITNVFVVVLNYMFSKLLVFRNNENNTILGA